ncbi:MAG: restriction endonuclease subunit S, partial [Bacteroides sp.]|nr:restriction endonuclease subunit S [Bacteroides sp.]
MLLLSSDNSYYEKILASGEVRCIDDEIPFEIPDSWVWCRLEQISSYIQRGKSPKYSMIKEIPVIAQKCNQWSGFQIEKAQFIEPASLKGYNNERLLRNGDLMWNSTGLGTLGRIAIYWDNLNPYGIAVADSHVTVIRPFDKEIQSNYLYAYFSSPTVQLVIEEKADGSTKQKELSTSTVKSYLIPLPPKDEQVRIIDKIRQLNPIIEKYGKLYDSLELLNKNLNIELKKSILQEAIQGKLVPQRTTEGTAEELFEKINAEKIRLVKEGRLKASALKGERRIFKGDDNKYYENKNGNIVCIDEIIPFDIPPTWQWSRVGSILNIWS